MEDNLLERMIISEMLMDPRLIEEFPDRVEDQDWMDPLSRCLFALMRRLYREGTPIDMVLLLENMTEAERKAYAAELFDIAKTAASTVGFAYHRQLFIARSMKRRMDTLGKELQANPDAEAGEQYAQALDKLNAIGEQWDNSEAKATGSDGEAFLHRIQRAMESENPITGIASGFGQLDKITCGFHDGEVTVIAARPSVGKSALATSMAYHIAKSGIPVLLYTLEMGREQIHRRLMSKHTKLDGYLLRNGQISREQYQQLEEGEEQIKALPLYIDDSGEQSAETMRQKVQREIRKHGVRIVIIDYIQLMNAAMGRNANRENEVAKISRTMKVIASSLKIPVIALSQLNRDSDKVERRPKLSDIRESGAIEQDADNVLMLWRGEDPDMHENRTPYGELIDAERELVIAKQRDGAVGEIRIHFVPRYSSFDNEMFEKKIVGIEEAEKKRSEPVQGDLFKTMQFSHYNM